MRLKTLLEASPIRPVDGEYRITLVGIENGRLRYDTYSQVVNRFIIDGDDDDVDELTSLEGCPKTCQLLIIQNLNNISSLDGSPDKVEHNVVIYDCPKIISLAGISRKYLKHIGGYFITSVNIKSNILGLMLQPKRFEGISLVNMNNGSEPMSEDFITAIEILNRQLKSKERDVMDCQEELIQAGLKEFAKL